MNGQTPDLKLKITGKEYVADGFLTNRPTRTLIEFGKRYSGEAEDETKSKRINREIKVPQIDFGSPLFYSSAVGG
jgi:hypothetical protein